MPSIGSCAMLGTANTMGCLAEAMGIMLPGTAAIPAVYSERLSAGYKSGKQIVEMVRRDIKIRDIITKQAVITHQSERGHRRIYQCGPPFTGHCL